MQILIDLTEEYITSLNNITCEIAVNSVDKDLAYLLLSLNEKLKDLNAEWVIRPCSTCVSHNNDKPLHLEIDKLRYI